MNKTTTRSRWFSILPALAFTVTMTTMAAGSDLAGRVSLRTPTGSGPLNNARVRLFNTGDTVAVQNVYTDSQGKFTFYEVKSGDYEIEVLFADKVLFMKSNNQYLTQKRVTLSDQNFNLGTITVSTSGGP
jgi:hypothetical protein